MNHHVIKIELKYWDRLQKGLKPWEVRKNDRDYQVGDLITFEVVNEKGKKEYTDNVNYQIVYILHGPLHGLSEGHCIMTLEEKL